MPDSQLLHLVIGGELEDVEGVKFRDLNKIDLVGAYPSHEAALADVRSAIAFHIETFGVGALEQ